MKEKKMTTETIILLAIYGIFVCGGAVWAVFITALVSGKIFLDGSGRFKEHKVVKHTQFWGTLVGFIIAIMLFLIFLQYIMSN